MIAIDRDSFIDGERKTQWWFIPIEFVNNGTNRVIAVAVASYEAVMHIVSVIRPDRDPGPIVREILSKGMTATIPIYPTDLPRRTESVSTIGERRCCITVIATISRRKVYYLRREIVGYGC